MPLPLPPVTFACGVCGWKRTLPFRVGDYRIPGFDHFTRCPRCGGAVAVRRANPLELLAAVVDALFAKRR